jgi:hypothetical protein
VDIFIANSFLIDYILRWRSVESLFILDEKATPSIPGLSAGDSRSDFRRPRRLGNRAFTNTLWYAACAGSTTINKEEELWISS